MIVVTGGNGQLGRAIAGELLRAVGPGGLRLSVREPGKAGEFAARGVEVREGDFDRPDTLVRAFDGATQLVLVSTDGPDADRLRRHRTALDAARRAGVGHVVYTSYVPAGSGRDLLHAAVHADTEEHLKGLGCEYTILRNNYYAELFLMFAGLAASTGAIRLPAGSGRAAMISRPDIAAAVAAAVAPGAARNRTLELTGPSSHGYADLAAVVARATGRPVEYHDSDDRVAADWLAGGPVPPPFVPFVLQASRELAAGHFAAVTGDFRALTGRDAVAAPVVWERALARDV